MKKKCTIFTLWFIFLRIGILYSFDSCVNLRPPFLTAAIRPNVLFILDNSGSMNEFAYHEVEGERCNNILAWTGYDEGKKYYGLFDPDKTYKYDNVHHYFYEVGNTVDDPNTSIHERAACLASNCTERSFSGNWLNWWTMRRFDVAKKVLTGGRLANDSNEYVLIGSPHERDRRRIFNDYASTDTPTDGNLVPPNKNVYYTPFHRAIYSYFFTSDPSPRNGQFVPLFNVVTARYDSASDFTGNSCVETYIGNSPDGDSNLPDDAIYQNLGETDKDYPSYYVAVKVGNVGIDSPPTGVIQNISGRVRLGYMRFNLGVGPGEGAPQGAVWSTWDIDEDGTNDIIWRYADGGKVINYIGDNATYTTPQGDIISQIVYNINEQTIQMFTPLSEVLNEAYRYFKQLSPCYEPGEGGDDYIVSNQWDPYYFNDSSAFVSCANSYIILVTDGESNNNNAVNDCGNMNEDFQGDGNGYLDDIAFRIHTKDIRPDLDGDQTIKLFTVFTFEESEVASNELKRAARAGGFVDLDGDGQPYCDQNCSLFWDTNFYPGTCDDGNTCNTGCREWDENCDGIPDNYFEADNGYLLEQQLSSIFNEILDSSAGTSVSILTDRTKKGSVTNQAVFYPKKKFNSYDELDWTGFLYTYWFLNSKIVQNIREDTINPFFFDIIGDYIINFTINESGSLTINAYESAINGTATNLATTYNSLDDVHELFEAGQILKETDPSDRTIYYPGNNATLNILSVANLAANASGIKYKLGTDLNEYPACLGTDLDTAQTNLINFIRGNEIAGCRDRSVGTQVWKLGDIIYSSPQIVDYEKFSLVFVGANDGMLHAFIEGKTRTDGLGPQQIVRICDDDNITCETANLGKEKWAFIPSNILPYLRYLARPDYYSCHLYFVDLSPYIIEEDTNDDGYIDKRILIGGLRLGGACGCTGTECINPPSDTCPNPTASETCIGLSSYFALDITNPDYPQFLWEFTDPKLGFSYSGPAYIKTRNGKYVMFVSGPTDYEGNVGQDLKIFVLELDDTFSKKAVYKFDGKGDAGFTMKSQLASYNNAFGGRLFTKGIDYDDNGTTDAVFFGVNQHTGSVWQGNVIGVLTNSDDPNSWNFETIFQSARKPITSKVAYMKCFKMNYIYFGTGRWFFKTDEPGINSNDVEKLYGVRIDECLQLGPGHCSINNALNSQDICNQLNRNAAQNIAWSIDTLEPINTTYFKERNITDPTISGYNLIFFTTTQPSADLCAFGGRARMWALNCATGGNMTSSCYNDQFLPKGIGGTLFLQLSRGNIEELKVSEETFSEEGGRATPWMIGIPPETSTPLAGGPPGTEGEIILWMEK